MRKLVKIIFLTCFINALLCITVFASDGLKIVNWDIDANVLQNGDLEIKEDISFKFSKKYNGVYREINFKDTSKVSDIKVFENKDGIEYEFKNVTEGKNGEKEIFQISDKKNAKSIKIFSPAREGVKTFTLKYKVLNESVKYNDIGELFYQFIGKSNETHIEKLNINITFCKPIKKQDFNIFAHGPLNGEIRFVDDDTISLNVNKLNPNNIVASRILFPVDYIKDSTNYVNENASERIINQELSYAKKTQEKINKIGSLKKVGNYGSFAFMGISIVIMALVTIKFRRKITVDFNDFHGIIPEECTPAVASFVYNSSIASKDIISTMLDLCRKGYLTIEDVDKNKEDTLYVEVKKSKKRKINKKSHDYIVTNIREIDDSLLEHEKYFIKWIISTIGDGKSVTLKQIKEFSKKNSREFYSGYRNWITLIKVYVKSKDYFDNKAKKSGKWLLLFGLIEVAIGIMFMVFGSILGVVVLILGLIFMAWSVGLMYRKSDYGYVQAKRWNEFKNRVKKVNDENIERELSQYGLDECLVYGMSLGMSQAEINKFKPYIFSSQSYNNTYLWWYFAASTSKNTNYFNTSIDSVFSSVAPSTGSGGGFSSGGSSGAGGGGGAGGF